MTTLRASVSDTNLASQRVLQKTGFVEIGRADPAEIGGKQGSWYERDLTDDGRRRTPAPPPGPPR
ncbi:hypothetical protein [Nocardioides mangrovi]|uniref:GNAT family N-acetyltransferase n=1 Tax=Nocardioides mangrovi TaxID=2874580 RepID=A0ABS7U9X8_9ACTN|nr:hypothetical protein [Nocardioides mangrovi]MBZ5737786.1 hypothetical protein [Nocardioides mangrovi]